MESMDIASLLGAYLLLSCSSWSEHVFRNQTSAGGIRPGDTAGRLRRGYSAFVGEKIYFLEPCAVPVSCSSTHTGTVQRSSLSVYCQLWKSWQEKSIVDKPQIISFLPLMKVNANFEGFSIKMESFQFFSEMFLVCLQLVEFTVINLHIWNVPINLLLSLLEKVFQMKYFTQYWQNERYFDTGKRGGSPGWQRM